LYKAFFDQVSFMIWIKDMKGKYISVNQNFAKLCNMKEEQIVGKTDYDLFPKDLADKFKKQEAKVIRLKKNLDFVDSINDRYGSSWYEIIRFPLVSEEGTITGIAGFAMDITRRKAFEEELQDSKTLQKAILDNIPHMAWLKDTEGKYVMVNEAFLNYFNRSKDDIIGQSDYDLYEKHQADEYRKKDLQVYKQGIPINFFEIEKTHLGKRYSETRNTPVVDESGKVIGITGILMDITEQKIAEKTLIRNEEKFKDLVTLLPEVVFEHFNGDRARQGITGHSMGGMITIATIEQFPSEYDGAMPLCGWLAKRSTWPVWSDSSVCAASPRGTAC